MRRSRPGKRERIQRRFPQFTLPLQTILGAFRMEAIEDADEDVLEAARALGLSAMVELTYTETQRNFLRGVLAGLDMPRRCGRAPCLAASACCDPRVTCYFEDRERIRALMPHIEDMLMGLALEGESFLRNARSRRAQL